MYKKIYCQSVAEIKLMSVVFVLIFAIAGLYTQYNILSVSAGDTKWKPLLEMKSDWYYYMSNVSVEKKDKLLEYIEENFNCLSMSEVQTQQDYNVYQYSSKAWEAFHYSLKKGDGFSKENVNEVIVSQGLADKYPVGTVIKINVNSGEAGESSFEFKVVGELAQEEIVFRTKTSSDDLHSIWNGKSVSFSLTNLRNQFAIVNPGFDATSIKESSGLFFQCKQSELQHLRQESVSTGTIIAVEEIVGASEAERKIPVRNLGIGILFWCVALFYMIIWTGVIIKKCQEDIYYLLYIGYPKRKVIRGYCCLHWGLQIPAFILSFGGYYMPSDLENFWQMDIKAPIVAGGAYILIGICGTFISYFLYLEKQFETKCKIPFIRNLTLEDNIVLFFRANGYSEKAAVVLCETVLKEEDLSFCAKRCMEMLGKEELHRYQRFMLSQRQSIVKETD